VVNGINDGGLGGVSRRERFFFYARPPLSVNGSHSNPKQRGPCLLLWTGSDYFGPGDPVCDFAAGNAIEIRNLAEIQ